MNLKWKSERGTVIKTSICGIDIAIHKYVGCGDMLFLSCHKLEIAQQNLDSTDFEEAKIKALKIIGVTLKEYVEAYEQISKMVGNFQE